METSEAQDVRALVGAVFTHRVMAAWAPHLGSISNPHPGEEVLRLGRGLADQPVRQGPVGPVAGWMGEANVKPLPPGSKTGGSGDRSDVSPKRGTGSGMELRALAAMPPGRPLQLQRPMPGKNGQSGRVKTRIADRKISTGTTHGAVLTRPAPSSRGRELKRPAGCHIRANEI